MRAAQATTGALFGINVKVTQKAGAEATYAWREMPKTKHTDVSTKLLPAVLELMLDAGAFPTANDDVLAARAAG